MSESKQSRFHENAKLKIPTFNFLQATVVLRSDNIFRFTSFGDQIFNTVMPSFVSQFAISSSRKKFYLLFS